MDDVGVAAETFKSERVSWFLVFFPAKLVAVFFQVVISERIAFCSRLRVVVCVGCRFCVNYARHRLTWNML